MGRGHGTKRRGEREELWPLLEPTFGDGESPSTAGLGADSGYGRCWWWGCQTVWDCCSGGMGLL
ncbi:hypothetical protein ES288_A01G039300v1 [Gossypium darwinii]|uniref:Uncharacterized protein n=1 Tax=Gossypium darwinii TaxID=34276 RepID=A0A5D2HI16_GOSDA|nr:hypothetical protein ES288_A01G039300v1 [Gossypium darwinii]